MRQDAVTRDRRYGPLMAKRSEGRKEGIMGSLKSPCTTSYRSSIDTIALNCLVFEKIAFSYFGNRQTNRQTDRQTNGWTAPMH